MVLDDMLSANPKMKEKYESLILNYNFTYDVPKEHGFIKLNSSISADRRTSISNGLRSFFLDDLTILIDSKDIRTSVADNLGMF